MPGDEHDTPPSSRYSVIDPRRFDAELRGLAARLDAVERKPSSIPPMRDREQSSQDLEAFAQVVTKKALEGDRRKDTTPEELVREVVAQEQARKDRDREFERMRLAELAAVEFEKTQALAKADAKRGRTNILLTAAVAFALFCLERLFEGLVKGHF